MLEYATDATLGNTMNIDYVNQNSTKFTYVKPSGTVSAEKHVNNLILNSSAEFMATTTRPNNWGNFATGTGKATYATETTAANVFLGKRAMKVTQSGLQVELGSAMNAYNLVDNSDFRSS